MSPHLLTHEGETKSISEWARDYGIPAKLIKARLAKGWTVERAITCPMRAAPDALPDDFAELPTKPKREPKPKAVRLPAVGPLARSNTPRFTIGHQTMTLRQWAAHLGVHYRKAWARAKLGWSIEEALGLFPTPVHGKIIEHDGKAMTAAEWAAHLGLGENTVRLRLKKMAPSEALIPGRRKPIPLNKSGRRGIMLTFDGQTMNLAAWAKVTGIKFKTLCKRHADGWSIERILTQPVADIGGPITFNGVTRTLPEWAEVTGIPYSALRSRRQHGWPLDRMMTEPAQPRTRRGVEPSDRGVGQNFTHQPQTGANPVA